MENIILRSTKIYVRSLRTEGSISVGVFTYLIRALSREDILVNIRRRDRLFRDLDLIKFMIRRYGNISQFMNITSIRNSSIRQFMGDEAFYARYPRAIVPDRPAPIPPPLPPINIPREQRIRLRVRPPTQPLPSITIPREQVPIPPPLPGSVPRIMMSDDDLMRSLRRINLGNERIVPHVIQGTIPEEIARNKSLVEVMSIRSVQVLNRNIVEYLYRCIDVMRDYDEIIFKFKYYATLWEQSDVNSTTTIFPLLSDDEYLEFDNYMRLSRVYKNINNRSVRANERGSDTGPNNLGVHHIADEVTIYTTASLVFKNGRFYRRSKDTLTKIIETIEIPISGHREIDNMRIINSMIYAKYANIKTAVILEYQMIPITGGNYNFQNYVERLRAYHPQVDQEFHRSTEISPTNNKLCIYQTYYFLYVNACRGIYKNKKEKVIMEAFEKESEEVKELCINGKLCDFLKVKARELNQNMIVQFFKPQLNNNLLGFYITPEQNIIEIDDYEKLEMLKNEKIFLYDCKHVAPRRFEFNRKYRAFELIYDILETSKKKEDPIKILKEVDRNERNQSKEGKGEYAVVKKKLFKILSDSRKKKEFFLKPTKKKRNTDTFKAYSFDMETAGSKAKPYNICLYTQDDKNVEDKKAYYGTNCLKEFVDELDKMSDKVDTSKTNKRGKINYISIYGFGNSKFDNIFLMRELLKRNASTKAIIVGSEVKFIKYYNILIFDLHLYYAGSLATVAKDFKLEITKGVFPYDFPRMDNLYYKGDVPKIEDWSCKEDYDEYISKEGDQFDLEQYTKKYCMLDCILTYKIARMHLNECVGKINDSKYDVRKCPTGASIALRMYNTVFQDIILSSSTKDILVKEREAYKGGRTEVFKKGYDISDFNKNLKYFDINSSYPSSMIGIMPYKYKDTVTKEEEKYDKNTVGFIDHYLYKARVKYTGNDPNFIPNILVRAKEGDIIALKKTEYAYHWGCELNEAIKNDCEVFFNEYSRYEGKVIFDKYVNYFYDERQKIKKSNPSKSSFYKLLLNSLYGKFGQKKKVHTKLCITKADVDEVINSTLNSVIDFEFLEDDIILKYEMIDDDDQIGGLTRLSSYIAAKSRCNLSEFMRVVGHKNIFYCDTDSVFCLIENEEDIKDYVHQTTLGKWKQEKIGKDDGSEVLVDIHKAHFLAPKSYYFELPGASCAKAKGMSGKEVKKLGKSLFDEVAEKGSKTLPPTTMFYRNLKEVRIVKQSRTMNLVYNKRIFANKYSSTPYENYEAWHKIKYPEKNT